MSDNYVSVADAVGEALPAKPVQRPRIDPAIVVAHHRRKLALLAERATEDSK